MRWFSDDFEIVYVRKLGNLANINLRRVFECEWVNRVEPWLWCRDWNGRGLMFNCRNARELLSKLYSSVQWIGRTSKQLCGPSESTNIEGRGSHCLSPPNHFSARWPGTLPRSDFSKIFVSFFEWKNFFLFFCRLRENFAIFDGPRNYLMSMTSLLDRRKTCTRRIVKIRFAKENKSNVVKAIFAPDVYLCWAAEFTFGARRFFFFDIKIV